MRFSSTRFPSPLGYYDLVPDSLTFINFKTAMAEQRSNCVRCGVEILKSTLDDNAGCCRRCKPPAKRTAARRKAAKKHGWKAAILTILVGVCVLGAGLWLVQGVLQPEVEIRRRIPIALFLIPFVGLYIIFQGLKSFYTIYVVGELED